jgi:cytochrome c oxidase assembly factor CtaG
MYVISNIIFPILLVFGISRIVTTEFIFRWFRNIKIVNRLKVFNCINCFSFWAGFFISFKFNVYSEDVFGHLMMAISLYSTTYILNKLFHDDWNF